MPAHLIYYCSLRQADKVPTHLVYYCSLRQADKVPTHLVYYCKKCWKESSGLVDTRGSWAVSWA